MQRGLCAKLNEAKAAVFIGYILYTNNEGILTVVVGQ